MALTPVELKSCQPFSALLIVHILLLYVSLVFYFWFSDVTDTEGHSFIGIVKYCFLFIEHPLVLKTVHEFLSFCSFSIEVVIF